MDGEANQNEWISRKLIKAIGGCFSLLMAALILVVLALVWSRMSGGSGFDLAVPLLHEPKFERVLMDSSDDCSTLFDFCVTVTCAVANTGTAAGTRVVRLTLEQGGPPMTHVASVTLGPGEQKTLRRDFTEASLGFEWRYNCTIDQGAIPR